MGKPCRGGGVTERDSIRVRVVAGKESENVSNFVRYKGTSSRTSDKDPCPVLEKQSCGKAASLLQSQQTQNANVDDPWIWFLTPVPQMLCELDGEENFRASPRGKRLLRS